MPQRTKAAISEAHTGHEGVLQAHCKTSQCPHYQFLPRVSRNTREQFIILYKDSIISLTTSNYPHTTPAYFLKISRNSCKIMTVRSPHQGKRPQISSGDTPTSLNDDQRCLNRSSDFLFINFCNNHALRSNFHALEHHLSFSKPLNAFISYRQSTSFRGY